MRRLIALGAGVLVLLVLVLAQLFLPGLAAQQLRDRLSKNGRVLSVHVSAFPAIELLWHDADKVAVRMASYRSGTSHLSSLLDEAGGVGTLTASVGVLTDGLLTLHDATLTKRGKQLTGTASVTESDLRASIPILTNVEPVASGDGRLTMRGVLFGGAATVDATVSAQDGKLIVSPDVPFGGFLTLTLFDDPHVSVQSVSASPSAGGFSVTARGLFN